MPKLPGIEKVLIIGSGPIVIGQACEFDYSGTQACKALRAAGYKIVLVNSNPATIMTDPGMADATYIEPLNVTRLEQIIATERPDALLPNLGGQTGLNLSAALQRAGVFERYGVRVIGVNPEAIERGEDRQAFKDIMTRLDIDMPRSTTATTVAECETIAEELGYPVVVRPAYTMGGTGGGLVYNREELLLIAERGLAASLVGQVLIEESVLGWEELELEVVRDAENRLITVCFIENVDPMGVHTGDSFCTAPMLTIAPALQRRLQDWAYKIVSAIEVIGGTNVQFAHDPVTDRVVIIEINPRTSRSSALASKATGLPIARVSAQLAGGLTLADLPYWRAGTLDHYEPSGDYVVVKFARWAFEKFKGVRDALGTQMRAVGEVMSIGQHYKEAFQKAMRSLENGRAGLGDAKALRALPLGEILLRLGTPCSGTHYLLYQALLKGADVAQLHEITHIKLWFLEQMRELAELEQALIPHRGGLPPDDLLRRAKLDGFSDRYLARLLDVTEASLRDRRRTLGIRHGWRRIPVSGVENAAYYYSTYNAPDEVPVSDRRKIMILGGGPNRIGQGIEFDYCCVHAALALREMGFETIMVNCNPETVSTDFDTSDKLYFEPLTVEDVLAIYEKEKPEGVIVQFGGQTPLNIAAELEAAGVKILGTSVASIALAEDRDLFRQAMERLGLKMPEAGMAADLDQAIAIADRLGYPVMVRPSYVLGGRGMEIVHNAGQLREYVARAVEVTPEHPILIDRFLQDALECEADALADGDQVCVPVIMEHIEQAGVHSGDSACVIPPVNIAPEHLEAISAATARIAREFKVVGLLNVQYAIEKDQIYVLEANPRASRTVPIVSKMCGLSLARLATQVMVGQTPPELSAPPPTIPYYGVKEAVLPFRMFPEVDPVLGPEMRSTGEVMGLADSFGVAYFKAQEAATPPLPLEGAVLFSLAEKTPQALTIAREFVRLGFKLLATDGTQAFLEGAGIPAQAINKVHQGRPNITDAIMNRELQLVVNTPIGARGQHDDSYIRKTAIRCAVPYITTLAAAAAAVKGIAAVHQGRGGVCSLQTYHQRLPHA
ncbi:MAG: carbamoyl-phosphate synthase large subunit [Candidatus Marinimicrobia bacterium]|nr:carbamoyl-phosphate synthase large subunit [Candidatus Neomarinimicrobiota bacterium]